MRGYEVGINHVVLEGSDEIDNFYASKSIPQRGTMPGGVKGPIRMIDPPQRGIKPGGVIGGPNDIHDPFFGTVVRHEK